MKIEKKHLDDIKRCYCASNICMNGENHILLASEDPDIACNMYSGKDFETKETVWTHPGGCMSIIPIPNKEKEFLAVQEFYLKVSPSLAKIVWGRYDDEKGWQIKDVLSLPYIHRFDIYESMAPTTLSGPPSPPPRRKRTTGPYRDASISESCPMIQARGSN